MIIDREALINSIINNLDNKKPLNTREYNIVRNAIIDSHIAICDSIGTCKECKHYKDGLCILGDGVNFLSESVEDDHFCGYFEKEQK